VSPLQMTLHPAENRHSKGVGAVLTVPGVAFSYGRFNGPDGCKEDTPKVIRADAIQARSLADGNRWSGNDWLRESGV